MSYKFTLLDAKKTPGTFIRLRGLPDSLLCCTGKCAWTTLRSSERGNHVQKINTYISGPKWINSYPE